MTLKAKNKLSKELEQLLKQPVPEDKKIIAKQISALSENEQTFRAYLASQAAKINSNATPAPQPLEGKWWRAINRIYDNEPLSVEGSRQGSSRFNEQGQDSIYLAESSGTSNLEVQLDRNFVTYSFWAIEFKLSGVLDLTDKQVISSFNISTSLFYGLWDLLNMYKITSYSQLVSTIIRKLGYEGFIYKSTKDPGKKCLIVFVDNLKRGSYLEVHDKTQGVKKEHLRVDGRL
ncbi:MAG: RES family NAD+ phosphorylase [Bacteriovoracaceae bacterium]